jgi:hypothetical protein
LNLEIEPVDGDERAESLDDSGQLYRGCGVGTRPRIG